MSNSNVAVIGPQSDWKSHTEKTWNVHLQWVVSAVFLNHGLDPKLSLWWAAIKRKLNFACVLLSSDTPKSLICTTNWLLNRYIWTCGKLGVFGWCCCLRGEWIGYIHLAVNRVWADTQIHCLCSAFNSGSVYCFHLVLGANQYNWRKTVDYSSDYYIIIVLKAALWQNLGWALEEKRGHRDAFEVKQRVYSRFHKPLLHHM